VTSAGHNNWQSKVATSAFTWIGLFVVAIWLIEIVDTFGFGSRLQGDGIHPRQVDGLDGILWAPFLHSSWAHVFSNTAPLAVLGGLIAIRGRSRWVAVTLITILLGGFLTWIFGATGNHIGASGVVFGYFGALVGAAIFERRPAAIAPALVAVMLYYGLIVGLVPQQGISWEGHLFGVISGLAGAKVLVVAKKLDRDDDEVDLSPFPPGFDFGQSEP
jgi:membrane associated rhomboid family serine protease